jgi:hypothetical protein
VGQLYHDSWFDEGYEGEGTYEAMIGEYRDYRRRVYLTGDMSRDERRVLSRFRQLQARYEIRIAMEEDRWLK